MYDLAKIKKPTREEEIELVKRIKKGDKKARDDLIVKNLSLVFFVIRRYYPFVFSLEEKDDIIEDGTSGLIKCIDKYNPRKGRFSTYATTRIRWEIAKGINKIGTIRLPAHAYNKIQKIEKTIEKSDDKEKIFKKLNAKDKEIINYGVYKKCSLKPDMENMEEFSYQEKNNNLLKDELCSIIDRSKIPERGKWIIKEMFLNGEKISEKEIGKRVGVTKQDISSLLKRYLPKIKILAKRNPLILEYLKGTYI